MNLPDSAALHPGWCCSKPLSRRERDWGEATLTQLTIHSRGKSLPAFSAGDLIMLSVLLRLNHQAFWMNFRTWLPMSPAA